MNVGQIKRALAKFGDDMDTAEIGFMYVLPNGQQRFEHILGVGIVPLEDTCCTAVVGETHINQQVQNGAMEKPEGFDDVMKDWNEYTERATGTQ